VSRVDFNSTAERLWASRSGAMLGAAGANRMVLAELPPELRAPFEALERSLRVWWPSRNVDRVNDIYWDRFPSCLGAHMEAFGTPHEHLTQLASTGAYLQMAAVIGYMGQRVLPADGFYDMGVKDFIQWLSDVVAAQERVDKAQMARRLQALMAVADRRWKLQLRCTDNIGWSWTGSSLTALPERLRRAAAHIDVGGKWSWSAVNGTGALKIEAPGESELFVLHTGDRAALIAAIPALG